MSKKRSVFHDELKTFIFKVYVKAVKTSFKSEKEEWS